MPENEDRLLSVGELAGKVGVTVRTLQYYDRCGLLAARHSDGGRRLYSMEDLVRLQQILFLKSFDFSLEDIRDKLLPAKSAEEIKNILVRQKNVLNSQISYLQEVVSKMDTIIMETGMNENISMEKFAVIMELLRQKNPFSTIIRYFKNEHITKFASRFESFNVADEFKRQSESLYAEMLELYRKGADPGGTEGQDLASRWWNITSAFAQGDPELIKAMISAGNDVDNWPDEAAEFKRATKEFLEQAFSIFFKSNNIVLPEHIP